MRPLRYSINVSLDGCGDHQSGFAPDEVTHRHSAETIARADALILGRTTYQLMEVWWDPDFVSGVPGWMKPFAETITTTKKYVASRTLETVDANSELIEGDVVEAVRRLKAEPGDGLYIGGIDLPRQLAAHGLIDEYEFVVHPQLVGHGPSIFAGLQAAIDLVPTGEKDLGRGIVARRYVPAGSS